MVGKKGKKGKKDERDVFSGPAVYYVNAATGQRVGVIPAVSRHFCSSCNRLRITATGQARSCLFSEKQVSILDALRARDEEGVREGLCVAAALKPKVGMVLSQTRGHMHKIGG
ncbi:MAG: hypothetical protein LBQ42_01390 [Synergistaceae bacterium]|nr:hypothetical protein [Synergistaceae bacterium]